MSGYNTAPSLQTHHSNSKKNPLHTTELVEHNIHTLKQGYAVLEHITARQYSRPILAHSASIGKHVRHVIDHYLCLINGITDGITAGNIDYDARIRDQQYELDRHSARQKIDHICTQLKNLGTESARNGDLKRKLTVRCSTSAEQSSLIDVDSTLERELVFLQSHTVHHFALIKIILYGHGIAVGEHFGIAPSTIKHMDTSAKP